MVKHNMGDLPDSQLENDGYKEVKEERMTFWLQAITVLSKMMDIKSGMLHILSMMTLRIS